MLIHTQSECLQLCNFAVSSRVYYAILLNKVAEGKFKRVGVALLYPSALRVEAKVVSFEIV
jgi:hypothetical protein